MIQKGKAYSTGYFNLHLELRHYIASTFSGSIKAFCIRKLTYKDKTSSTRFYDLKGMEINLENLPS